jgi:hypothetical protein
LISLTLLISPFWIKLTEIIIAKNKPAILSSTPA